VGTPRVRQTPVDRAEAEELFQALKGMRIAVAFSGGPDSTALLGLLNEAKASLAITLCAITIDHGLRPESASEAAAAAAFAEGIGVPHEIRFWTHEGPVTGLQEKARNARYALLAKAANERGAEAIVTAHTLDDQAETLLMRMAAGSGLSGLGGMRPVRKLDGGLLLMRPLLGIEKARLVATRESRGWPALFDPSNALERFSRVRWRAIMPGLAAEGLDAAALGRLAQRLARADAALEGAAAILGSAARREDGIDAAMLFGAAPEIALRVLGAALGHADDKPVPLGKLETVYAALVLAGTKGQSWRATLHGQIITLSEDGLIRIGPEGPRRRGFPRRG
jgi:tRNA(Ile)-lysidine synthase